MHTKTSAASRSVYSRPDDVPLERGCSLSCLLLLERDLHWAWEKQWQQHQTKKTQCNASLCCQVISMIHFFQVFDKTDADLTLISFYSALEGDKYRKTNIIHVTVPQSMVKNLPIRGRALWVTGSTPCPIWTASGSTPRHLPWPNIDQIVTCCQDEPCEIPIKPVYIRKGFVAFSLYSAILINKTTYQPSNETVVYNE